MMAQGILGLSPAGVTGSASVGTTGSELAGSAFPGAGAIGAAIGRLVRFSFFRCRFGSPFVHSVSQLKPDFR